MVIILNHHSHLYGIGGSPMVLPYNIWKFSKLLVLTNSAIDIF